MAYDDYDEETLLERDNLLDDIHTIVQIIYWRAGEWFYGERDEDLDERLDEMAEWLWTHPDATRNDGINWAAEKFVAWFKEDSEPGIYNREKW